jgi:hypothetical protein
MTDPKKARKEAALADEFDADDDGRIIINEDDDDRPKKRSAFAYSHCRCLQSIFFTSFTCPFFPLSFLRTCAKFDVIIKLLNVLDG